ncbi:MAG: response regulator [Pseudanabaenaceae cyanobacterium]
MTYTLPIGGTTVDKTKPTRILVVDDDPTNFDVIEALLFHEKYTLDYTSSGTKVIERLKKNAFDLLLVDVMMPELDGIELCRQIKLHPKYKWIPIIMVTALDSKQDLARCLDAGADDFISKPINGVELRARVRSLLRIKAQQAQIQSMLALRAEMTNAIIHDLRNPITAILLANSSLQAMDLSPPIRKKCDRIQSAITRLSNLVEDILILSKLEAGKLTLQPGLIQVPELLHQVIEDMQIIASAKSVELVHTCNDAMILWGDANLLRRAIENLVANAIKFSPPRSAVQLSAEQNAGIIIRVSDQGVGIPSEKRQTIWERYESGDISATVTSIGLGLSFCKLVVEAHQGRIEITDNSPSGSIFSVYLPDACPIN